jgi:hypothetical protein
MPGLLDDDEAQQASTFLGSLEDPTEDLAAGMQAAADMKKAAPKKPRKPKTKGPTEPILVATTSDALAEQLEEEALEEDEPPLPPPTPNMSKSARIRALWAHGWKRGAIAKELGISYQHVFGVTKNMTPEKMAAAVNTTANCSRCGRELVDPRTAVNGMGPICARKAAEGEPEDDE